jgi:hypothetical protein
MKERLAPFLTLLEARYAPLLFAVAPQAYAVYLWLYPAPYSTTGEVFAVMGGLGYEFIYVGAIAWAEEGRWSFWTWATAVIALVFSMIVAYYVYRSQGGWAWLHSGFPLVAFGYTMNMHTPHTKKQERAPDAPPPAHVCAQCGGSVASQQTAAASVRWGCGACKAVKTNGVHECP